MNQIDEENENDISMELIQMQNETIWLIQREIPVVCKRVKRIIQRCIELLQPSHYKQQIKNRDNSEQDKIDNIVNSNNNNEQIEYLDDLLEEEENQEDDENNKSNISKSTVSNNSSNNKGKLLTKSSNLLSLYSDISSVNGNTIINSNDSNGKKKKVNKFETESGCRGMINLDGWFVDAPEVIIRFMKPLVKSTSQLPIYKTSIQKSKPWRIQQIQNVYNYLCSILSELDHIIEFSLNYKPNSNQSNSPVLSSNSNNNNNHIENQTSPNLSSHTSPSGRQIIQLPEIYAAIENIKSLSKTLSMAKDELVLPSRNVFPATLYQPNVLVPLLPFEINVDITVSNCEILLSFHELSITSMNEQMFHYSKADQTLPSPSKLLSKSSNNLTNSANSPLGRSANGHLSPNMSNTSNTSNNSSIPHSSSSNNLNISSASIINGIPTSNIMLSPNDSESHNPDYNKKPFQTNKSGSNQWVNVVDHSEARVPFKNLTDTFSLLTNAYDKLAELGEKFLVLSNIN